MTISLTADLEARLNQEAARRGLTPSDYAVELLERSLPGPPSGHPNQATLDLLAKWDQEDATDDPEEIARRQREAEEFMQNLNRNRIEMEGPNSRKLWP